MKAPIFAGFLAVLSAATVDLDVGGSGSEREDSQGFLLRTHVTTVSKTVRSSTLRLVFWVGLEGSGHHYMVASFDRAFSTMPGYNSLGDECLIRVQPYFLNRAMAKSPLHYAAAVGQARDDMRALARCESSVSTPGAVEPLGGEWSYPAGGGAGKVFQYLDVVVMAELAEAEGVDFRIIYLKRSAKDVLVSTTVHRRFDSSLGRPQTTTREESFMDYARIMHTDTAVMHSYLSGLDPTFVVCHDMDYAGDVQQASAIAEFVTPSAQLAEALMASLLKLAPPGDSTTESDSLPVKDADVVVQRLQRQMDTFESTYCHSGA